MPTNYPTTLDDLAADNPAANDPVDGSSGAGGKPHHAQHDDLNSAVDALESTVGVTGAFNFALLASANLFTNSNTFHAHVAFGADSAVDADPLGFYVGTFFNVVSVEEEITDLTAGFVNGVNVFLDLDPSATPQTGSPTGVNVEVRTDPANAQDWTAGTFNAVVGVGATVNHTGGYFINSAIAANFQAVNSGTGSLSFLEGLACVVQNVDPAGSVFITYGVNMAVVTLAGEITISYAGKFSNSAYGGLIDTAYGCWVQNLGAGGAIGTSYGTFVDSPSGVTGNNFAHWIADQSGWGGTNCYAFWYDSPGVYRIKHDGVMAYYNPAFSPKYTPGGADYERVVQQWNTNVIEYGAEAGGTGTLRKLRLLGTTVEVPGLLLSSGAGAGKVLTSDGSGNASWGVVAGTGTVTAVSVASANGFAGTSSGGATPALTLTTSITGVLKGNGTAISASNVTDDAQTKAAIVPNTAPSAGQILVGNVGGTAYAPQTPTVFNVKNYGALGDTIAYVATTSITSGAATLTVTAGTFAAGDVGKTIVVPGAGAAGADLKTTISARASTTSITLAANASTTLTSVSKTLTYGTDDTTAVNAAIAALNTATAGVLYFPASGQGYLCTAALTALSANGVVQGDGMGDAASVGYSSRVLCTSATAAFFTVNSQSLTFRYLTLKCVATTPTAGGGIIVTSATVTQQVNYDHVTVDSFYDCVDVQVGFAWTMFACNVINPAHYGVKIANTVNADAGGWSIVGGGVWMTTNTAAAAGIHIASAGGGRIADFKVNGGNNSAANAITNGIEVAVAASTTTSILLVNNCSVENVITHGFAYTSSSGTSVFGMVQICNCQFGLYGNTTGNAINVNCTTQGDLTSLIIDDVVCVSDAGNAHAAVSLTKVSGAVVSRMVRHAGFTGGRVTVSSGVGVMDLTDDLVWINMTLLNSWANDSGVTARYRRVGGVVYVEGSVTGGSGATATVFTLPAGYRPSQTVATASTSGGLVTVLAVDSDGTIRQAIGTSTSNFRITASFLADQ